MLEEINLENASGIIANFTGGEDLAFSDVVAALTDLHDRTGGRADIIPGVISDPRMEDRVQVILVLTGLGGTSLDQARRDVARQEPANFRQSVETDPVQFPFLMNDHQPQNDGNPADPDTDLDIPAFMRRKLIE
jgi:cell division protein FtsZ